uniref:VWFA domain-containing protein n=1 Tax=Anas zonorhyncha TaxID=75864 RepID=A0A8B9VLA8_9AVES
MAGAKRVFVGITMPGEYLLYLILVFHLPSAIYSATPAGCKNVHYDLVFILDASSSVGKEDFEKVRQWVANLVETFEIGPDKTRVGVVRYSDRPTTEFELGKYKTREEIKEAARKIKYYGGNTNTGDALRYINTYSFSKEAGGRLSDRTVKKVAILLTDGRSQDYVLDPATAARQAGIRIFAVGVGEALKEELDEIASEPKSAHVFHVSDYNVCVCCLLKKSFAHLTEYNAICPWLSEPVLGPHISAYHSLLNPKGLLGSSLLQSVIIVTCQGVCFQLHWWVCWGEIKPLKGQVKGKSLVVLDTEKFKGKVDC